MAFTKAGLYQQVCLSTAGQPLARVSVSVYLTGTTTLATLYTDQTASTTRANPVQADAYGNLAVYAAPGFYDLTYGGVTVTVEVPVNQQEVATNTVPSDVAPRGNPYDAARALYNGRSPALQTLRAGIAQAVAGSGYANILCVGDSTTEGYGAGADPSITSYPVRLSGILRTLGIPDGGTGWVFPNQQNTPANVDSRWSAGAAWTNPGQSYSWLQTNTNGAAATFSSDSSGTILDLAYFDNGGAFTYSVDGAAPVTVTPTGTSATKVVTVTGLSNTTHTVTMTTTSTATTYLVAARVRQTSGLQVTNAGIGGTKTTDWSPSQAFFFPTQLNITGLTQGTLGTYAGSIVSLGLNEQATAAATFQTQLQSVIQACQGSVLLMIPPTPSGAGAAWTAFRQAYYNLADSLNLPLIDLGDLQGSQASANNLGLRFDALHPNAAGYSGIAQAVAGALAPNGAGAVNDRRWVAVNTFANGWVNFAGAPGFANVGFRKDASGYVHLRGLAAGGTITAGTTVFTLPAGYRPALSTAYGTVGSDAFASVRVANTGAVTVQTLTANTYLSFDGITFLAEA